MNKHKFTNRLAKETSPYLLQHAHNPVDWYPWGQEALHKAKEENKLILISIGYSACHWCHVMERESFEDEALAKFLNDNFVCIKVDREERPDIDRIYMQAVQLLTGRGGWPLNCIALPDTRPIYGGTYYPKNSFLEMLTNVLKFVKDNPQKTMEQAENLTEGIRSTEFMYLAKDTASFSRKDIKEVFANIEKNIDYSEGGFSGAPKFPLPIAFEFILNYAHNFNDSLALKALDISLNKMAMGGIYDQIAGGFSRYSVDDQWMVPHFEKMLYDNAQLISLYSKAYCKTKNDKYLIIVKDCVAFIERELADSKGAFYSSLDADSQGVEGMFYVWTMKELRDLLGDKAPVFIDVFNVVEKGNWENDLNILYRSENDMPVCMKYNLSPIQLSTLIDEAREILLSEREKRIRPALDDKILTAWNALTITALVDAFKASTDKHYLDLAITNADFILSNMKAEDAGLLRNFKDNNASISAFLDDYAFCISAFIALYETTFDTKYLDEASSLTDYCLKHFFDKDSSMFFYTSDEATGLIARTLEVYDNVIPSSNSTMAINLFKLGHLLYKDNFIAISARMLANVKDEAMGANSFYSNWYILMSYFALGVDDLSIVGEKALSFKAKFDEYYLPSVIFSGGSNEEDLEILKDKYVTGKTRIYICRDKICSEPLESVEKAIKQLL